MNRLINLIVLLFQILFTFFLLFGIYIFYALLDYNGGIDGFIVLTLFQTFLAAFFSFVTIVFCLVIGLPIRVNRQVNAWWLKNWYVASGGFIAGLIFILLSILPAFEREIKIIDENGMPSIQKSPDEFLALTGWVLVCFFALHIFFPKTLLEKMRNQIR